MASASSKPKLSSLFTHYSPTIPSSNHPKCPPQPLASPEIPPENFNRGFSFKHRLHTFLHNCKTGNINIAFKLHEEMLHETGRYGINCKPDVISYSIIIDGLCKDRQEDKARELFEEMKAQGMVPDVISYNSLIHGFCRSGKWEEAKFLFNEMVDQGVRPNLVTFSVLIDMFCKAGKVIKAKELLEMMIQRGKLEAASELFEKLSQEGLQPDVVTYNIMIHGFCKKRQVDKSNKSEEVVQLLHRMVQKDVSPDACTCTIGVDMLCKDEKYQEFLDLLPRFPVQERRH
ncbi:pentatricopeptide repeat-containing protein At3g22470, mitochondrial-like [Benincasa hispida]|uniref:pentatricopeptide repeat-containing protein At3g22470, mitochondrial-like n=1 Tax=Benincasa hispida TaxID=102211 RepID=UPI001902023C|nr:pentatricopeptide repeat-containing protein At3g22470, mitochondrial-like [Benincasa hispida]